MKFKIKLIFTGLFSKLIDIMYGNDRIGTFDTIPSKRRTLEME